MLIRLPESWPQPVVAAVAMLMLAALDLGGAFAAKEAVERRSPLFAACGVLLFVGLFWVFASSLQYAELAPVTFGWVVLLQVGVLMLDRFRYQVELPAGKWVAVVLILAAQAYLLVPAATPAPPARSIPASETTPMVGSDVVVPGPREAAAIDLASADVRADSPRRTQPT